MKKKILGAILTLLLVLGSFVVCFGNDEKESKSYDETKQSIDSYIDSQLEKIDTGEIEGFIKESSALQDINLKTFIKELISGEKTILDLFNNKWLDFNILIIKNLKIHEWFFVIYSYTVSLRGYFHP